LGALCLRSCFSVRVVFGAGGGGGGRFVFGFGGVLGGFGVWVVVGCGVWGFFGCLWGLFGGVVFFFLGGFFFLVGVFLCVVGCLGVFVGFGFFFLVLFFLYRVLTVKDVSPHSAPKSADLTVSLRQMGSFHFSLSMTSSNIHCRCSVLN